MKVLSGERTPANSTGLHRVQHNPLSAEVHPEGMRNTQFYRGNCQQVSTFPLDCIRCSTMVTCIRWKVNRESFE